MTNPTVAAGTMLVIRTDGTEAVIEGRPTVERIEKAIGAKLLDFVRIGKADRSDLVMAVDDNGWETETVDHGGGHLELRPTKPRKPINPKATALYHAVCIPGTTHQIVGDVAVLHNGDFR